MKKLFISIGSILAGLSILFSVAHANTTGGINLTQGGTGWVTSTAGDIYYGTTSTLRYSVLPIGTNGSCLQVATGSPVWQTCPSGGGGSASAALPYGGIQYSVLSGTSTVLAATSSLKISTTTGAIIETSSATSTFSGSLQSPCIADSVGCFVTSTTTNISSFQIVGWGDSLTAGGQGGAIPYTQDLAQFLPFSQQAINEGYSGDSSTQILNYFNIHPEMWRDYTIIWSGRNGPDNATTLSNIETMVNALPSPKHFLVMSIINSETETSTTTAYASIISLNNSLEAEFPNNYIDVRAYLVSKYNPSIPQDVIDHTNDTPPYSLHATGDPLHLNSLGYWYVAQDAAGFIASTTSYSRQFVNFTDLVGSIPNLTSITASTSGNNFFVGPAAGNLSMSGTYNEAIGQYSLTNLTTGSQNTTAGPGAGQNITTGNQNVLMGIFAAQGAPANASQLTCVGVDACYTGPSSASDAFGYQSQLDANNSSFENSSFGFTSLGNLSSGSNDAALGFESGFLMTTGVGNTFVGDDAGGFSAAASGLGLPFLNQLTTGSHNTFVGYFAQPATNTEIDNSSAFGFGAQVGCSDCIVIGASSTSGYAPNVGIGSTSPLGATFVVAGNIDISTTTATSTFSDTIIAPCFATTTSGPCITPGSGSGAVSSVSNSDGTITVSPTTGSVVASLALGHANTWTGGQIFGNSTTTNFAVTGSATSTFTGGIISPCFATSTAGSCIVPGSSGGGGSSQWTGTSPNPIYYTGGVSIGTTSNPFGFTVATDTDIDNGLFHSSTAANAVTITSLQLGPLKFAADSGVVRAFDLPVDSSASNNTVESYDLALGGTSTIMLYGQADGSGNIKNIAVGIATSTPAYYVSIASSTNPNVTTWAVDTNGHVVCGGPAPSVSGGTSSVVGHDCGGNITVTGTALTSVTLTFAKTWSGTPICTASDNSTVFNTDPTSISTTAVTFGFTATVSSATVWYSCEQI